MISHIINRLKNVKFAEQIILATTKKEEDKILIEIAKKQEIFSFTGNEKDVLKRYFMCAKKFDADPIIRITGDCPLCDPKIIQKMIKIFNAKKYDYISNRIKPTFPDGLDVEIFSFKALKKSEKNAKMKSEREHVTPYIYKNSKKFSIFNVKNKKNLSHLRWTVDEKKDLKFVKKIYQEMNPKKIFFMNDVLEVLKKNPKFIEINQDIVRDEGYLISKKNEIKISRVKNFVKR
jgi:spore coat polysaccharide biosynthesis protein SpsF (cytidylyltransferase family)